MVGSESSVVPECGLWQERIELTLGLPDLRAANCAIPTFFVAGKAGVVHSGDGSGDGGGGSGSSGRGGKKL